MRQMILGAVCALALVGALFAADRLQQTMAHRTWSWRGIMVVRVPKQLLAAAKTDGVVIVSVRDACGYIALGSYQQEINANFLDFTPRRRRPMTDCTPFLPRGSQHR